MDMNEKTVQNFIDEMTRLNPDNQEVITAVISALDYARRQRKDVLDAVIESLLFYRDNH